MSRGMHQLPPSRHFIAGGLALVVLVQHIASATAEQRGPALAPELMLAWRTIFARPTRIPAPPDNPVTAAKRALGQQLFFDKRLSRDCDRSCATCHQPERAFADGLKTAHGLDGKPLRRNTPSLFNLAWSKAFYWDGRAPTLEAQARVPIEHPNELGMQLTDVALRLKRDQKVQSAFARAFGDPAGRITPDRILKAMATYERSLVSPRTRFDAWIDGDTSALSDREQEGFALFVGKAGCVACHVRWRFTDNKFHDVGLNSTDAGRGAVPGGVAGLPAFKTPSLRELTHTAPYMHDGSLPTLRSVVEHYSGRFVRRSSLSSNMVRTLILSSSEKNALVAFLKTLSSRNGGNR